MIATVPTNLLVFAANGHVEFKVCTVCSLAAVFDDF